MNSYNKWIPVIKSINNDISDDNLQKLCIFCENYMQYRLNNIINEDDGNNFNFNLLPYILKYIHSSDLLLLNYNEETNLELINIGTLNLHYLDENELNEVKMDSTYIFDLCFKIFENYLSTLNLEEYNNIHYNDIIRIIPNNIGTFDIYTTFKLY